MSYGLELAADARAAFASLEIWLQEQVLDELERLLENPSRLMVRPGESVAVHDFVCIRGDRKYYIFLTIRPDYAVTQLTVLSLGHVER